MVHSEKAKLVSMMVTVTSLLLVIALFNNSVQDRSFQISSAIGLGALYVVSYVIFSRKVFSPN